MVHIQRIRKQNKKIVSIRIQEFNVITNNLYTGFQKRLNLLEESGKVLFNTWVREWSKDNYLIQINSHDFYILKSLRYI